MRAIIFWLAAALGCGGVHAGAPFVDNLDGTVTDTSTGLMWDQCARGLSGADCATGTYTPLDWPNALGEAATRNADGYKGYSDWRLPSVVELLSLNRDTPPLLDPLAFPNSPAINFWSSTTTGFWVMGNFYVYPPNAWMTALGGVNHGLKTGFGQPVRLVRGGEGFGSIGAALGGVSGIAETAITLTATAIPVAATGYWMVVARGAARPTVPQVIAPLDVAGVPFVATGQAPMAGRAPTAFSVTDLTAGTNYDLYLATREDTYRTTSALIGPVQFSTAALYHALDVDGNGKVDALTDGLILLRYIFGLRGPSLTGGAIGSGASRDAAQIEEYMHSILP